MREYTIVKKGETLEWSRVPVLPIDTLLWREDCGISAFAKICYDEENLYVYLEAKEENIRAVETSPIGSPWEDSCLEFFFRPEIDDDRYMNFEFNPNACFYVGIGHSLEDLMRLIPDGEVPFNANPVRTEDGWYITYQIPRSFLRIFFPDVEFVSGKEIRANCYKCGNCTVHPHYLSWNPVLCEKPAFHRPEDFGVMYFE